MSIELVAGIDDVATERQLTSGWGFVVLPKANAVQFSKQAQALLPTTLPEFHAKTLKAKDGSECRAYEDFLSLLRTSAEATPECLLAVSLNDLSWDSSLKDFAHDLFTNILGSIGVTDKDTVDGAADVAPALFTLSRLLTSPSSIVSSIEVDQNLITEKFARSFAAVNQKPIAAPALLAIMANKYRELRFPQSPAISGQGICIVESSTSFLVQAADVLGNFSINYALRNLGTVTAGRAKKAEIFERVFHDILPHSQFSQLASLSGPQLELALKHPGALTFQVS